LPGVAGGRTFAERAATVCVDSDQPAAAGSGFQKNGRRGMPPQTLQHGRGRETIAGGEAPQSADGFSVFGNVERRDSHSGYAVEGM